MSRSAFKAQIYREKISIAARDAGMDITLALNRPSHSIPCTQASDRPNPFPLAIPSRLLFLSLSVDFILPSFPSLSSQKQYIIQTNRHKKPPVAHFTKSRVYISQVSPSQSAIQFTSPNRPQTQQKRRHCRPRSILGFFLSSSIFKPEQILS